MTIENYSLSEDQIAQYQEQGYLGPFTAITPAEAQQYREIIYEKVLSTRTVYSPDLPTRVRHLDSLTIHRLINLPPILGRVSSLIGKDLMCWYSNIFDKKPMRPNNPEEYPWHQDSHFNRLEPMITVSVWLGLTAATLENGCVDVLPGTHKQYIPLIENHDPNHSKWFYGRSADPKYFDDSKKVSMVLDAGQFFLFDLCLMHHSNPNRTKQKRLGLAIRYATPSVKMLYHDWPCIMIAGENPYQLNPYVAPPVSEPNNKMSYQMSLLMQSLGRKVKSFLGHSV